MRQLDSTQVANALQDGGLGKSRFASLVEQGFDLRFEFGERRRREAAFSLFRWRRLDRPTCKLAEWGVLRVHVRPFLEIAAPLDFADVLLLLSRLGSRWTPATREALLAVLTGAADR